jgi:hypothetical protein
MFASEGFWNGELYTLSINTNGKVLAAKITVLTVKSALFS